MSLKNFKQFFSERAKQQGVVSDDKGFANRDYEGSLSTKPKEGKQLSPKEYYAPNADKNPGLMTADGSDRGQAFGDMATPGLNPKNSAPHGEKPADKTKKIGKKKKKKLPGKSMKTENFLDKTRRMSDAQFAKYMMETTAKGKSKVRDLYGEEYTPEPAQAMKYVAGLMISDENMMRRMVRELKRSGGFEKLVSEVLQHPETYEHLNEAARGDFGKTTEKKIAMFFEGISPPRTSPGPASAGAPAASQPQGGAFGGGGAGMATQGLPGAGMSGGPANGGGFNVKGGGMGGMPGMGEEEMMPGMGMGDDEDMKLDDDDHDDELDDDDDKEGLDDDDDDDDDDDEEDLDDDEDDEDDLDDDEDDDEEKNPGNINFDVGGAGSPGMGMGGPSPMGM